MLSVYYLYVITARLHCTIEMVDTIHNIDAMLWRRR